MVKHNNMIPNAHFHKDWTRYCRVLFNQPLKKRCRQLKRNRKMRKLAPRPINKLRPIVQCPTQRYKSKLRLGRGFSLSELAALKFNKNKCRTIGISVDHRRRTNNVDLLRINTNRLKDYMSHLILYPLKKNENLVAKTVDKIVEKPKKMEKTPARVLTEYEKKFSPFLLRRNLIGLNKKRRKRLQTNKQE